MAQMELTRTVTVGQYLPGSTLLHRLDPRTKIFLMAAAMLTTFTVERPASLGVLVVICFAGAITARIPLPYFVSGLRSIALILVVTLGFNLFFAQGGQVLVEWGPVVITTRGVSSALLMTARLMVLYLLTSLFTLTTSPLRITDALESLLSPLRHIGVPASEIAMMMSIALRFIPTLVETTEKIMKSQMARGAPIHEGSLVSRLRAVVSVLVPLLLHSLQAAEELAVAMEARCYRGGRRTRLVGLCFRPIDLWMLVTLGSLLAASCWLEWHA